MTCVAAGLGHAFANAANLVDAVHYNGTAPAGTAYTTVPGNSLGSVPQAELNALADIMQYCTNSGGGVAGDSSNCGNFFADATPSGGTAPVDTLSAMINVAKNPTTSVGGTCTGTPATSGGLFCLLAGGGLAFQPVLATVPHDWTLAITYTGLVVGSTSSSWGSPVTTTYYPEWLALDANDDVYVIAGNANTSAGSVTSTMASMTSNGTGIWTNASTVDAANGCYPGMVALDTNGNVWNTYAAPSSKTCTAAIYGRSAATGGAAGSIFASSTLTPEYTVQGQAFGLAFDRSNNLWYARDTSSGSSMMERFPYAGAAGTYQNQSLTSVPAGNGAADIILTGSTGTPAGTLANTFDILIDANSNVYVSTYSSSVTGVVYVVPNLTPASTPSYSGVIQDQRRCGESWNRRRDVFQYGS